MGLHNFKSDFITQAKACGYPRELTSFHRRTAGGLLGGLNYPVGKKIGFRNGETLFVGEYIFETFYEPIDDKSYDSENDCDADKKHEFRRKNKHRITP